MLSETSKENIGHCHANQSFACETAINTDFSELFSLKRIYEKYTSAILSHIYYFFRTWKDLTHGQVLSKIHNIYDETRSQDRTHHTCLFVQFFHVQNNQSICGKIAVLYFT